MTYQEFVDKAVKEHRRRLSLPVAAWGDWQHVYFPSKACVRFSKSGGWRIYGADGAWISSHDSRDFAIKKASKLT